MTYVFECEACSSRFDVICRVSDMDIPQSCRCGGQAKRIFAPGRVQLSGTKVQEAEYNPGLGCVVRNKSHRAELCKIKGLEEIGNTTPDTLHKMHDKEREYRREKAWNDADKGWVGNEG